MRLSLNHIALLTMLSLLGACQQASPRTNSQVLARVNDGEITLLQLQRVLGTEQDASASVRDDAIKRLINRELAVQAAQSLELERSADVMQKLEEARRDVLATAWADRVAATLPPPDENAVARYYADHPGLFSQRKLYRLREISIVTNGIDAAALAAQINRDGGLDRAALAQLTQWLAQSSITFTDNEITRLAEQLPIDAVDELHQRSDGAVFVLRLPNTVTIYQILKTESMPVSWAQSQSVIRAFLSHQSRQQLLDAAMQGLHKQATIAYNKAPSP